MRNRVVLSALAAGVLAPALWAAALAHAETQAPLSRDAVAGSPDLRDARVPASVPNISGIWTRDSGGAKLTPQDGGNPPWLPWAEAAVKRRHDAETAGVPMWDPTQACLGSGMPRILAMLYPTEIIQTPDQLIWMYESQHVFRIIRMNAEHRSNPPKTAMGDAVAHWEGETLVIDTIGLSGKQLMDDFGNPQTDQLHLVERINRHGNFLENFITIDDPGAYSKTWIVHRTYKYVSGHLLEYVCEENNRNPPGADGVISARIK